MGKEKKFKKRRRRKDGMGLRPIEGNVGKKITK